MLGENLPHSTKPGSKNSSFAAAQRACWPQSTVTIEGMELSGLDWSGCGTEQERAAVSPWEWRLCQKHSGLESLYCREGIFWGVGWKVPPEDLFATVGAGDVSQLSLKLFALCV